MYRKLCMLAVVAGALVADWSTNEASASVADKKFNCYVIVSGAAPTPVIYQYQMEFISPNLFYPPIPEAFGGWSEFNLGALSLWQGSFDAPQVTGSGSFKGIQTGTFIFATGDLPPAGFKYLVIGTLAPPVP